MRRSCVILLVALLLIGCGSRTGPRDLTNDDPAVRIPEIRRVALANDRSSIPQLIELLDDDDPAVRFYAIESLERFTGQTLDYRWFESDRAARYAMVNRWRDWLNPPTTSPATGLSP